MIPEPARSPGEPSQIERADVAFKIGRVAQWLHNDPGFTRAMAAKELARVAHQLSPVLAALTLGDAADEADKAFAAKVDELERALRDVSAEREALTKRADEAFDLMHKLRGGLALLAVSHPHFAGYFERANDACIALRPDPLGLQSPPSAVSAPSETPDESTAGAARCNCDALALMPEYGPALTLSELAEAMSVAVSTASKAPGWCRCGRYFGKITLGGGRWRYVQARREDKTPTGAHASE